MHQMKTIICQFSKKPFVRNVVIMTSGTAAAQLIAVAASPIITRLYGPEVYGMMGVFQSTAQIIVPIAALTYPVAIVLPKSDQDAKGIMRLSIYISIALSVLSLLLLLIFNKPIVELFNIEEIAPYTFLFPLVILFSGLMQVNEQWLIRTKQFRITAKTMFYRSLFINGGRVGIGFYYPVAAVLISLTAVENGFRALMMRLHIRKSTYKLNDSDYNKSPLKSLAKKYKNFPIYRSPHVFISALSQNMPVLLLTFFFGPASAGFFAIGRTVLNVPSQLIGKSIGDVFYPRISEAINKKEHITKPIIKATVALFIVGIIPYGIIMAFGPSIFSLVFGSDWSTAGEYARWMAFWVFCMFLNRPSTKALPAMFAQAFQLKYATFTLVIRFLAFVTGYYFFSDDLIALAFFSIVAGLLSLGLIMLTLLISKKFDMENVKG
ncbi:lipopolysaccharide biosynthesis protein [Lentibacillus salinarum]|uniref:Lipopolysaccharide biosynthesis protein n=1 Tax=Lentibacillus salinarum TaxID=446820 RepID=A0ABW3ZVA9_9BACI